WPRDHPYTKRLSQLSRQKDADYDTLRKAIEHPDPAICANVIIGLIKITNYLLDRQIRHLENAFVETGGLSERMTQARLKRRKQEKPGN
ncbi:MAG: four helix bundle suffix domain-containing protein, partial [Candidatus Sumerlaeota bacterium]